MIFHLEGLQVSYSSVSLFLNVFSQFAVGHRFLLTADKEEVLRFHSDDGVQPVVMSNLFLEPFQFTYGHVVQSPLVPYVA